MGLPSHKKAHHRWWALIIMAPEDLPAGCTEALNAPASLLEKRFGRRIGDAEVRTQTEGRAINDGDPFCFQEFRHEILIGLDDLARRRRLADQARAGRIDIES